MRHPREAACEIASAHPPILSERRPDLEAAIERAIVAHGEAVLAESKPIEWDTVGLSVRCSRCGHIGRLKFDHGEIAECLHALGYWGEKWAAAWKTLARKYRAMVLR